MSAKTKTVILSIFLILPVTGFLIIGIIINGLHPFLATVIISIYLAAWAGLCFMIYQKIRYLKEQILREDLNEKVISIPKESFLKKCEEKLLKDGYEKRVDIYNDGEIEITATCFYRTIDKTLGKESDTVFFLEGVKAFSDLINTEENLNDSLLNSVSDPRLYSAFGQVIAIVSPYPEKEIYDFCVNSYYNQQKGVLFVACDKEAGKAHYSSLSKKNNKSFYRSEALVKQFIENN